MEARVFAGVLELKKSKNTVKTRAYKHLHGLSHLPVSGCGRDQKDNRNEEQNSKQQGFAT